MSRKSYGSSCEQLTSELPDREKEPLLNLTLFWRRAANYLTGVLVFVILYGGIYWALKNSAHLAK